MVLPIIVVSTELLGYSIFYLYRCMEVKIHGVPRLWLFSGVSIFFQGVNLQSLPFSGWQTQNFFRYHFLRGTELSKIKFQGIYKSNNHSFQGVLVFKNLVFHTPVWIKNRIAHSKSPIRFLGKKSLRGKR